MPLRSPEIPSYEDSPRADRPGIVTDWDFISKDDPRAPSVHCSTIAVVGSVRYVTWFGGSHEGARDVKIWFTKNEDDKWSRPKPIAGEDDEVHWNPVIFLPDQAKPEHLIVFYRKGDTIPTWFTCWIESLNGGGTWSDPKELVHGDRTGGRGPQKNSPIVLSNGDWCAGGSYEVEIREGDKVVRNVWDAYSEVATVPVQDTGVHQGDVWIQSRLVDLPTDRGDPNGSFPGEGVIQPGLWESKDKPGHVHMTMRSSAGCIMRADSEDYGRTWSPAYRTMLPNNNWGHDIATLRDGRIVWVGNYNTASWGPRTPLCLMISEDDGETWKQWATLDTKVDPEDRLRFTAPNPTMVDDGHVEFSYPSITPTDQDDEIGVWVTYTWQRRGIKTAKVVDRSGRT